MFRVLGRYIWQHKGLYLVLLLTIIVYDLTLLVPTQVIQGLVDQMTTGQLTQASLWRDLVFLVGAAVLNYVSAYFWFYKLFQSASNFRFELQGRAFRKLLTMRTAFYEAFRSGDMMTRFTTDVDSLRQMLGYGLMIVVYGGGMIAFILPAMFLISWRISLLACLPLVAMGVGIQLIAKKQDKLVDENREAVAELNNEVLEVVEGVRVARAYSKKAVQSQAFAQRTQNLRQVANRTVAYQALYGPLTTMLIGLSTMLILWSGAKELAAGRLSLGQVMALQLYMVSLVEPMWMMSDIIYVYQTGKTSFAKIEELLETGDKMEAEGQLELASPEVYDFRDYSFSYPQSDRLTLDGINWTLKRGQTVGIVGKTGSGKTTLIRQFLRQYPLGDGSLTIDGRPVTAYRRASLESQLGYVPQEHILFSKSVRDNLLMGQPAASAEDLERALETAVFAQDVAQMSQGLETLIGEKGVSISGGQKQRLSIARAFLRQPELLILDDSLSAVDAKTEQAIISHIQEERAGKTTLIVAHRLSAVHHADWVLVMDEGRIVQEGRPEDLLAQGGWYADQYNRQQGQEDSQ